MTSASAKPAAAHQLRRPLPPGPAPTSSAIRRAPDAAACGISRRTRSSPSAPANSATLRLVAGDVGRQRAAVGVGDVRRVGEHRVERAVDRLQQVALAPSSTVEAEPRRVGARHVERLARSRRWRSRARSGRSVFSASATAPEPVPTSTTRAPCGSVERGLDEVLGLRPRHEHPRRRPPARCCGTPCGRGCRRPARAAPAAARSPGTAAPLRLEPAAGVGDDHRAVDRPSRRPAAPRRPAAACRSRQPSARSARSPARRGSSCGRAGCGPCGRLSVRNADVAQRRTTAIEPVTLAGEHVRLASRPATPTSTTCPERRAGRRASSRAWHAVVAAPARARRWPPSSPTPGRAAHVRLAQVEVAYRPGGRLHATTWTSTRQHRTLEVGGTVDRDARGGGPRVNAEAKLLDPRRTPSRHRGAHRVTLKTDHRNERSQAAERPARARSARACTASQYVRMDGPQRDTVIFSVIAAEWPEVRDRFSAARPERSRSAHSGTAARLGGAGGSTSSRGSARWITSATTSMPRPIEIQSGSR